MVDYIELAGLADKLFEISDDDDERLAEVLDTLDGEIRRLSSPPTSSTPTRSSTTTSGRFPTS